MPLRDHFRPPVNRRHAWDKLHGGWPMKIVEAIEPQLPLAYAAAPQVYLGGAVEFDVGSYDSQNGVRVNAAQSAEGGIATAAWTQTEPTLRVETELPDVDEYEVRIYDLERQQRLVAAIELGSPSNKDRPDTRRAFVTKCAALLQRGVSVTIIDVVTTREFNLYAELLAFLNLTDPSVESPEPIYAGASRGAMRRNRWLFEAWHRPLSIGRPLPKLPIWLADDVVVTLDLEASYEETCRVLRIT